MANWNPFPHDNTAFEYSGGALKKAWSRLHAGDREPYPQTEELVEAWRSFHRGEFQRAV